MEGERSSVAVEFLLQNQAPQRVAGMLRVLSLYPLHLRETKAALRPNAAETVEVQS